MMCSLLMRMLLTVSFLYISSNILVSKSYAEEDYIPVWHSDTYVPSAASLGLSQIKILPDGSMLLRSMFGLYKRKNLNSPWKITLIEWSPAIVEIKSIDNIKYQLYAHVDKGDKIIIYASNNLGDTWVKISIITSEKIVVDNKNYFYKIWANDSIIKVMRSKNMGRDWVDYVSLPKLPQEKYDSIDNITFNKKNDLYISILSRTMSRIKVYKLKNNSNTLLAIDLKRGKNEGGLFTSVVEAEPLYGFKFSSFVEAEPLYGFTLDAQKVLNLAISRDDDTSWHYIKFDKSDGDSPRIVNATGKYIFVCTLRGLLMATTDKDTWEVLNSPAFLKDNIDPRAVNDVIVDKNGNIYAVIYDHVFMRKANSKKWQDISANLATILKKMEERGAAP